MRTVVALYDRFEDAQQAVQALHDAGFGRNDINMIARDASGDFSRYLDETREGQTQDVSNGAAAGAGAGAILGGLGGLLVGLGALAIPGIGPVLAAGPIVTALAGAGVGAVAGGLIGALVDLGIPEEHANYYAEGVRRGGTLVLVRTPDEQAEQTRSVLNRFNPIDIENRAQNWRDSRWTGFDQNSQELTADQMEFNRTRSNVPVTGTDVNRDLNSNRDRDYVSGNDQDTGTGDWNQTANMSGNNAAYNTGTGTGSDWSQPSDVDNTRDQGNTGSDDIPVTGGQYRHDRDMDDEFKPGETFNSGMNEHLAEDVYGSDRVHEDMVDIPVTGARMDSIEVDEVEEVDKPNPRNWDPFNKAFQEDYTTRFANTGWGYDYYQPAYRYGYDLANNPNYQGYDWNRVEPVARQEWERRGLRGAWDDIKGAVRHAWETVTNL